MTRRRIMWALLWKEWRSQRMLWAIMTALSLAMVAAFSITQPWEWAGFTVVAMLVFSWCGLSVLLGANTFTGETGFARDPLSEALPASRSARFWCKLLAAAALLGICEAVTLAALLLSDGGRAFVQQRMPIAHIFLCCAVFLPSSALVAPWCPQPLATGALAAFVGLLVIVGVGLTGKAVGNGQLPGGAVHRQWALFFPLLAGALVVFLGRWSWTRVGAPRSSTSHRQ